MKITLSNLFSHSFILFNSKNACRDVENFGIECVFILIYLICDVIWSRNDGNILIIGEFSVIGVTRRDCFSVTCSAKSL